MNFLLLKCDRGYAPHLGCFLLFFLLFFTNQMNFRGSELIAGGKIDIQTLVRLFCLIGVFSICSLNYKVFVNSLRHIPLFFHAVFLVFLFFVTCMPWTFNFYSTYAFLTHIVMFCAVVVLVKRFGFENTLYYYVCGGSIFCVLSVVFYYFVPEVGRYWYWNEYNVFFQSTRMSGIAGHPNSLGFMCATGIVGIVHLFFSRYPIHKALFIGGALLLFCLVMTHSRTSLAGMILMVGLYVVIHLRLFSVLSFSGVLVLALFLIVSQLFGDAVFDFLRVFSRSGDIEEITSFTGRSYIWEQMFVFIERRPFFGWGHATMSDVLSAHKQEIGFEVGQAHNLYLQIMFSSGLVGFFLFMVGVFVAFYTSVIQAFRFKNPFFVCVLIYILIASLTESFMLSSVANNAYLVFILFLAGLTFDGADKGEGMPSYIDGDRRTT